MVKCMQVGHHEWLDNLLVHKPRPHEPGMIQPRKETALDHEVKRNPRDQEAHDVLHDRKQREDDPVGKPLRVVSRVGGVNGLEGHVGGVGEGEDVRNQLASPEAVNDGGEDHDSEEEEVNFRLSGFLFEVTKPVILTCRGVGGQKIVQFLNYLLDLRVRHGWLFLRGDGLRERGARAEAGRGGQRAF